MKTILYFHQSAELYGSDKTLFFLVKNLPKHDFRPIVVLPEEGPLSELLREFGIELIINPVIKLSRTMFSLKSLILFPFQSISSLYKINKKIANRSIDLVQTNTLAVLLGAFYAKWKGIDHVWHIHEIIEKPKILNKIYSFLVNRFSTIAVFNSEAALKSLIGPNERLKIKSTIIYNGVELPANSFTEKGDEDFASNNFKFQSETIVIGLVGRISRWKGQILLLNAFEKLIIENANVHLLFIGSPPKDQEYYLENLKSEIESKSLGKKVSILPFTANIWKYWSSIDIAVVPSTEPEPFGLVAVEAMLMGKPVVAAAHGGLVEIIDHNITGLLFEPNNVEELFSSLKLLVNNESLRNSLGLKGQKSVSERFTIDKYVHKFIELYQKELNDV